MCSKCCVRWAETPPCASKLSCPKDLQSTITRYSAFINYISPLPGSKRSSSYLSYVTFLISLEIRHLNYGWWEHGRISFCHFTLHGSCINFVFLHYFDLFRRQFPCFQVCSFSCFLVPKHHYHRSWLRWNGRRHYAA